MSFMLPPSLFAFVDIGFVEYFVEGDEFSIRSGNFFSSLSARLDKSEENPE